jgi:hypothetical protein
MFDTFISITKEDYVLSMIGNLTNFLPSTCSCQSEKCFAIQDLPSPITKSSLINRHFIKSEELKFEFLKNAIKVLDWIFCKSKKLNEHREIFRQ